MTDIVDQLEQEAKELLRTLSAPDEDQLLRLWDAALDAAAEIKRLREEVAMWRERCQSLLQDMHASEQALDRMLNDGR